MRRIIIFALLMAILLCGCTEEATAPKLEIIFFDVGKADSFFMQCDGDTLLMDAGKVDDGEYVAEQLRKMGIQTIDHFIITHFDKDHVGGAAQIINEFDVKNIYQPEYMKESDEASAYINALEQIGAEPTVITESHTIAFGGAVIQLQGAIKEYDYDTSNNSSLITTINHGDMNLLFTGDIEKERINDWLDRTVQVEVDYDFLKVPHHGKYEKILPEFFEKVDAEYAVITSSNKNPEEMETLEALKDAGVKYYLTRNGDIYLESNGEKLSIKQ